MTTSLTHPLLVSALNTIKDPETSGSLWDQQQIRNLQFSDSRVSLSVALSSHSLPLKGDVQAAVYERLQPLGVQQIDLKWESIERPAKPLGPLGVTAKSVIAVGSGKGGVGKSTIAASLAVGLNRAGCKVGLLDADMYGPSIPQLFGLTERCEQRDQKLVPVEVQGIKVMSIGFMVPREEAVIWRGPILHGWMQNFLKETLWGDLDYLVIDMPPGTGDIALSLSQMMPPTGAVIVCTPQEVALLDAVKAIAMFRKLNINILGMVENMSGFICPSCEKRYDIFGSGGARKRADELRVAFLGDVPINIPVREHGDAGTTISNFDDPIAGPYLERVVTQLARNVALLTELKVGTPALPTL